MSQDFPELYEHSGGNIKIDWYLSNCTTKADLKGTTGWYQKQI